jgi:hypothetical protein
MEDRRILRRVCGQEIFIDQILIHEQLGISKEGVIYTTKATFEEVKTNLKELHDHIFLLRMNNEV